jgi:hypothetical protein
MFKWLKKLVSRRERPQAFSILDVLRCEIDQPLDAPTFLEHVERAVEQPSSRIVMISGYRTRLIEQKLFGEGHLLVARIAEKVILELSRSDLEKISILAQHLNDHDLIGLGEPVRPYTDVDLEQLWVVADGVISANLNFHGIASDDAQLELLHRCFADGYVYRVAEELVASRLSRQSQ